jgi:cell wall-active antibiotic response 4TMS protein YvqF
MDARKPCRRRKHGLIVWGILLIANGVLLLIGRLGLADIHITAHLWPILPLTLGALRLIDPPATADGRPHGRRSAIWLVFIGCWGLVNELHLFGLDYGSSWPLLLIFVGFNMVWRSTEMSAPGEHGERRTE